MNRGFFVIAVLGASAMPVLAQDMGHGDDDPAPAIFSAIRVELGVVPKDGGLFTWDVDGWAGGDIERVWIRSEGEVADGSVADAELQLYYGWNIDTYWDALLGVRQDFEPNGRTYLAASLVGLAPFFFETEGSLFLSDEGDLTGRFEQRVELLLTNELIAEPHAEVNLAAQDVPDLRLGAGITGVELGLQLRYEISRRFAPYVDAVWERKVGETAALARAAGEDVAETSIRFGIRLLF